MNPSEPFAPLLMLGAGRMGGAMLDGWALTKAIPAHQIMIRDPHPGDAALAAAGRGARLNPPDADLANARTVVLAVKPQLWREVAAEAAGHLGPDAVIVSIAAGVRIADIAAAFDQRRVARVMPTTAAGIGKGVASIVGDGAQAQDRARALFAPLGAAAVLPSEAMLDAATAVSGSSPAYLYAFIEALEAAGVAEGLPPDAARALVRATMIGAAALLEHTGAEPAELRRQVTSPNGTTEAALKVLMSEQGLGPLLAAAVDAAARRSRELAG